MNKISMLAVSMLALLTLVGCEEDSLTKKIRMDKGWQFKRLASADSEQTGLEAVDVSDKKWRTVRLPHTARTEAKVVSDQWQGVCWYRKTIDVPDQLVGKKVFIELEAAMSQSKIWINGELVKERMGGYLPVVIDATNLLVPGEDNTIAIRLDNRDNPLTGPKPLKYLDFNTYGGLYRNVWVTLKEKLYISNPILADKVAGGGIFITTPKVSEELSQVAVKAHIVNDFEIEQAIEVEQAIYFEDQLIAKQSTSALVAAGSDVELNESFDLTAAKLWSPKHPNLYHMTTTVTVDDKVLDTETTRFGIRSFVFKGNELFLNGEKIFLRGVNRHQEYPIVGYAMSDNAQRRDAQKIKDAGFNHVRLSHYPMSPAFMDACDELGLITLDAIMGWQYYLDDDRFREYCYRSTRELIRRDRNRPSVIAWEASLNETQMPVPFMEELHSIVHAEYPGSNVYSLGWIDGTYDIFEQARQHRLLQKEPVDAEKPYFVSEYGDWEYYSNKAGLNQGALDKTTRLETSSRQLRSFGEKRMLCQAKNVQEAHNDNLQTTAYGDAYWVMYDYNRGYHSELESSGIMDIFRLPKFAYYFYQSQRDPSEGVVVNIASFWTEESALDLTVYSNCDSVELWLNDRCIATQAPDSNENTTHLGHPPFTFEIGAFEAGSLRAVGLIDGLAVGEHIVQTPGEAVGLEILVDGSGVSPQADCNDTVFVYISVVDENGTVVPDYTGRIKLNITGNTKVLNEDEIRAEAGIATALVQFGSDTQILDLTATAEGLEPAAGRMKLRHK